MLPLALHPARPARLEEVVAANYMHLFKAEPKVMAEALTKLDELFTSLVLLRSSSWPESALFDIEKIYSGEGACKASGGGLFQGVGECVDQGIVHAC